MKVKLFDKKLRISFLKYLSAFAVVLGLLFAIFDFPQYIRLIIVGVISGLLVLLYLLKWKQANNQQSCLLNINNTKVKIEYGNLFESTGNKIIGFNEYFDTQVDDKIISKTSLNGLFIDNYIDGDTIDEALSNLDDLKLSIIEKDVNRPLGGKRIKYKLGTICPVKDYFLLALTHFNFENKAYISVEDYICCLMHMWNNIDRYYAGNPIVLPLLGSGITRFNDSKISNQDLLEYMLITLKASNVQFSNMLSEHNEPCIYIILSERVKDTIDLYKLEKI